MSKEIDERVVEMRFDNKQFEAGVQTSLSTLDKLKKGLDLDGAAKGFDQLSTAAKKCDMSTIGRSVESVQAKFSALQVVAMTVLSNITNSAINTGKQLLSSLTIQPISTGFSEYELKMGSIQTIMASTGESLDRVNQKLNELNAYSDKTIYSFSDMTQNIGKFTNAGVKLDDAVSAIQGVANVAAVSGANANEASRAMYNFGQALSSGYVKLIDWKSIELANMATAEFKQQLIDTALEMKTLVKVGDKYQSTTTDLNGKVSELFTSTSMFNDSLSAQWMTTEVLSKTLAKYADVETEIGEKAFAAAQDVKTWSQLLDTLKESAQSGWAETWQLVAGDYEEAKTTLRAFSEFFSGIISGSSDARNSLLQGTLMSSWGQIKDRVNETGNSVDTFREVLRETAESSVDGLDKMIEEAGSFDATLSKGWLTTDILADTLDNMVSKAMGAEVSISDLSDEQLKNVGYTQEQIDSLRTLSEEARSSSGNIADLVNTVGRQSGRELLFDSLLNGAKAIQGLFNTVKGAWQEIFPQANSEQLYSLIEGLHSASERLRDFFTQAESGADGLTNLVNKPLQDIKNTFKGLFAVLDIVKQAFDGLFRAIAPAGSAVGSLLTGVLGLTGGFGEWLVKLNETIEKNDIFYKGFKAVIDFIKGAVTTVSSFGSTLGEKLSLPGLDEAKAAVEEFLATFKEKISVPGFDLLHSIFENLCERAGQVKDAIFGMKDGIVSSFEKVDGAVSGSKFVVALTGVWNLVKTVAGAISTLLGKAINGLIDTLANANFNSIIDFLNALATGGLVVAIKKFVDMGSDMTGTIGGFLDWAKGFGDGINKTLDGVRGCLEGWQAKLKADALLKIAAAVGVLAAGLLVLSTIDSQKLTGSLAAITTLFLELMGSMVVIDKLNINKRGIDQTATAMVKIGAALLIMSVALKKVGELEPEQMAIGLAGIAGLAVIMSGTIAALEVASKKFKGGSIKGLITFSAAIGLLAMSLKSVAKLKWEEIAKGLAGITGLAVIMGGTIVALEAASKKYKGGSIKGLITFAAAIGLLAISFNSIAKLGWSGITKGLIGLTGIAIIMGGTIVALEAASKKYKGGSIKGLITFAAAIGLLTISFKSIADEDWSGIAKGLTGLAGMAVIMGSTIVALEAASSKYKDGSIRGLITFAAATGLLTLSFKSIADEDWNGIAKGLTGVAGLAVVMGGALAALTAVSATFNDTSMLKISAAMLVMSSSILVLTPAMKSLGSMSWESIAKGLVAIAGAFTVMGVAGAVLGPLAPAILTLSGALALIGVSAVAIGAGLTLIGTGLTSVSVGLTALATALTASVTVIVAGLSAIIVGIAGLIPAVATQIGQAIVAFCGVIANGAPAIGEAVKAVVLSLIDVLVECVPAITDGALTLVTGVLSALVTFTPQIIDSVMLFLIGILDGIARNIPQLVQSAMNVVGAFFDGVLSALSNIDSDSLIKGVAAMGLLTALVAALGAVTGLIPAALVGVAGMGVVITELAIVLAAIGGLAQIPGLQWLVSEGGHVLQTIGEAIGGFVGGIVGGFMSGVSSSFPQIGADLSAFMTNIQPFIDGASSIGPELLSGISNLTGAILLITAADLLEGLTSWLTGGSSLADFGNELVPFGESMVAFSNSISGLNAGLVDKAATAGKTLAEMAATLPDSGGVVGFFTGENDMDEFGEQLVTFGGAMMNFAASVKGLDTEAVQNAAIAGEAMAEMAATLPNTGGAVSFFTGNSNMDAFDEQLVPFGKAVKEYSLAVAGLDIDAVTNSATAGMSLVELAKTLPNTSGIVTFFTGGNDLGAFSAGIVSFGAAMRDYGNAVAGLESNSGTIEASAIAGKSLVELANTLPNCGGLTQVFTGSNSLSSFGGELVQFGKDLSAYAVAIKDVQADTVTASANAAKALSDLASGLPDSSLFDQWFGGDQTLSSFGKEITAFGTEMSNYYSEISGIDTEKLSGIIRQVWSFVNLAKEVESLDTSGFNSFGDALKAIGNVGVTEFTNAFINSDTQVVSAVRGMLNKVSASISNSKNITTPGMQDVMASLVKVVTEKASEINTSISNMMTSVSRTIRNSTRSAKSAMQTVMIGILSGVTSYTSQFYSVGANAGQGFINGIGSKLGSATSAGRSLGLAALDAAKKALDSHSPSREFIYLGENMGAGLAIGAKNSIVPASQATSEMIDEVLKVSSKGIEAFQKWAEEKKYYGELGLKDELTGYENLQKKYKAGSEERIKIDREVYRIQNELVTSTYQASLDWIEEEKYYNRLSTEEELAAYERMQKRYIEGSEERMAIDKKIYTLRNQLMDESYQQFLDWIEEEKYYNRLTLSDELAAYKRIQSSYAKGSEERKKTDREIYRLEKEIYEAQQQYASDAHRVQSEANQKRIDLEQEYADKVKSINDKLASDIQSLNDQYQNAVESRTKSLYQSYGLFDAVKEREEVSSEVLMKNLQGQVQEFGQWQDILDSLSARGLDSELIGELQEMGPSAISELKALNAMSDSELEKYAGLWAIKHAQARDQAVTELEGLRIETQNNIAQLRIEADQELEEYRYVWQQKMDQITVDSNAELEQLRRDFEEKVGIIKKNTEMEMQAMADAVQAILREAGWDETGKQIVAGLTGGVESEKPSFLGALVEMAMAGVQAVKNVLDINSPSRVFRELGNYTGLGFVGGLKDYAGKSYDAGANMAESAKDGLSNAISMVAELANGDFDMQPAIRPVLDLSDVTRSAGQLNSLFYPQKMMALAGQTSLAFNSTMNGDGMTVKVDNHDIVDELHSLRSEMAEMTARLERMQVVLDTGTLVGEMADPLDSALGQKQSLRGRGI